ncbi:hypothetical protein A3K73_01450 [Candidatus Pacearchaeota archaeon RBG_13_36_9]|nr:MAG: hypothetical protein A3K73_01450 [Candidatus Pacearchaeota archaeon RBG_13_36_9]
MFDSSGRLIGVDDKNIEKELEEKAKKQKQREKPISHYYEEKEKHGEKSSSLKKSDSLYFLKETAAEKIKGESDYWSFYSDGKALKPLKFSNGKTQEDIVKEVVKLIKQDHKVIFLHGVCGSGKSAIALNIARTIGKASIVVPLKSLQKQYEEDYSGKKYLLKSKGERLKIASITGRDNHDSIIQPGVSCAHPNLPENIKISEKNINELREFYEDNPLLKDKSFPDEIKSLKRMMIAPSNPYWSPILPADYDIKMLYDAEKKKYKGIGGREFIFYHRKKGCSYYDQYLGYIYADVIIFNSAKYKAELSLGRKPLTEVDIIDEADEFLDSLFEQKELNLNRLHTSLKHITTENKLATESKNRLLQLIENEIKNKRLLGIKEDSVFNIQDTNIKKILEMLLRSPDLEAEIILDELNYSNKALETARSFSEIAEDVYLTYRQEEESILVKLVSTNLSGSIKDILDKNKTLVFMSGTLHSKEVIKDILGIKDFKIVEAETINQGSIDIIRTGKESDCRYSSLTSGAYKREDYLFSLSECVRKAKPPVLIHVNSYKDLPTEKELQENGLSNLVSSEELIKIQSQDKSGANIIKFKHGLSKTLFTTKCSRGMDFPGGMCNSVLFTKYPNPNISDTFWKILKNTHKEYFWKFYTDKAKREFLQRIYRAIRSTDDHIYVLSPDLRVIEAVKKIQRGEF